MIYQKTVTIINENYEVLVHRVVPEKLCVLISQRKVTKFYEEANDFVELLQKII